LEIAPSIKNRTLVNFHHPVPRD